MQWIAYLTSGNCCSLLLTLMLLHGATGPACVEGLSVLRFAAIPWILGKTRKFAFSGSKKHILGCTGYASAANL